MSRAGCRRVAGGLLLSRGADGNGDPYREIAPAPCQPPADGLLLNEAAGRPTRTPPLATPAPLRGALRGYLSGVLGAEAA